MCNSSIQEDEAGTLWVLGYHELYYMFEANQDYIVRVSLNKQIGKRADYLTE